MNPADIAAGDKLEVRQAIVIAPDDARVYLQYGQIVSKKELKNYYPHCWFVSWERRSNEQQIRPDTFLISRVVRKKAAVTLKSAGFSFAALAFEAGNSFEDYVTELEIVSERQSDIKRLICSHWEDPADARHLTTEEIQKSLGEYAKVKFMPR
jgi:hypothetical protein